MPLVAAGQFLDRLQHSSCILVAVSGGSDSVGLLVALHRAAGERHRIVAASIDHALRPESADEARAVAALCAARGIAHLTLRWEGEKPKTGLSAAARAARYRLLKQAAAHFSADLIVTAHTADDQDETVLMRAARTGDPHAPGLAGMAEAVLYDRTLWIARPFLASRRQAIRDALTEGGIGWIDDPSNVDPRYERVRMRLALAQGSAAAPDVTVAAERREKLSGLAATWIASHVIVHAGVLAQISHAGLDAPNDVLRFSLSGLIAVLGGRENGPSFEAMSRFMAMLDARKPDRMTLGRVFAALRRDGLFLMRERRDLPVVTVPPGGDAVWDGRFVIRNPHPVAISVAPAEALSMPMSACGVSNLAPSLVRRAAAVLPRIVAAKGAAVPLAEPRIAPYDLFLPVFDLAFASSLAQLVGREVFTAPAISR